VEADGTTNPEQDLSEHVHRTQLEHFSESDPRCRVLQLPDGVLLRYTLSQALYFYLRTTIRDGKIFTRVYSSDSPYDRQKAAIGDVATPMFEAQADYVHLKKIEKLLRGWVEFVGESGDSLNEFMSFKLDEERD
jgi:hypothetical protein